MAPAVPHFSFDGRQKLWFQSKEGEKIETRMARLEMHAVFFSFYFFPFLFNIFNFQLDMFAPHFSFAHSDGLLHSLGGKRSDGACQLSIQNLEIIVRPAGRNSCSMGSS